MLGVHSASILKYKQIFVETLHLETSRFVPVFETILSKDYLWTHLICPRIKQFRAEIINMLDYQPELFLPNGQYMNSNNVKPILDVELIKVCEELHLLNGAIFQIAVVMLGEDSIMNSGDENSQIELPFFDLDSIVEPVNI